MRGGVTESHVEEAALGWLGGLGYTILKGPEIAPGEPASERTDYSQVVLEHRLREALTRLNRSLPREALEDALRRLLHPDSPLITTNHAFHRMLVDGVPVQFRRPDETIGGDLVRLVDFDDATTNDWVAVNQFTVIEGQNNRRPDIVKRAGFPGGSIT